MIDDFGIPFDLPSTHPRLFSSIVSTPGLFYPSQYPLYQPFTYSTMNSAQNPANDVNKYKNNLIISQSRCHNNYPTDGLSLAEFQVLQSAILSATAALCDMFPLPRQVLSLSRSLLFLLLEKYPIYAFGPLNMIPIGLIFASSKLLELNLKYVDLFLKFNAMLDSIYHIRTSAVLTLITQANTAANPPPNLSQNPSQPPQPQTIPDIQPKHKLVNSHYLTPETWFQEYLPPYLCAMNDIESQNGHKLDQFLIFRYQYELCHLLHQVRLETREIEQFDEDGLFTLPYDGVDIQCEDKMGNRGYISPPHVLLATKCDDNDMNLSKSAPISNVINQGLNGYTFNESWLQYTSSINYHYSQNKTHTNFETPFACPPHLVVLPQPLPSSQISSITLKPSTQAPLLPIQPTLSHGSFLFQFLLLSLFTTVPQIINTEKIDLENSSSVTVLAVHTNPEHPGRVPPHFVLIDALIFDTVNFKASTIAMNPLPDITLALLHRLQVTIPLSYTIPADIKGFFQADAQNNESSPNFLSPLLNIDINTLDEYTLMQNFLQFTPDFSNPSSLTHLAFFASTIAHYAESLPIQLFYPPQIISIAIVDLVLSLLQLPAPSLLPPSIQNLGKPPTIRSFDGGSISNDEIIQEYDNGEDKSDRLPQTQNCLPRPAPLSPDLFSNNILSNHFNTLATQSFLNLWNLSHKHHTFIQNGFIKRSFSILNPQSSPPQSSPTTIPENVSKFSQTSHWYHHIIPGLDPNIVLTIALTILEGTKLGYTLTNDVLTSNITLRILALYRYPWSHLHQGLPTLNGQGVEFGHFLINSHRFLTFHSNSSLLRAQVGENIENSIQKSNLLKPIFDSGSVQQSEEVPTQPEPISNLRTLRRKALAQGTASYTDLTTHNNITTSGQAHLDIPSPQPPLPTSRPPAQPPCGLPSVQPAPPSATASVLNRPTDEELLQGLFD
jgi:hypothetical protein